MTRSKCRWHERLGALMLVTAAAVTLSGEAMAQATAQQIAQQYPKDQKLIAAAKAEGSMILYGSASIVALKADADGFEKTYGIPVKYSMMASAAQTARVDQEIRAGRISADVIISADRPSLYRWAADGQLAKLPDMKFPQQSEYIVPIQTIYQGVLINTDLVPKNQMPRKWSDLVNPKYAGKIVVGSPRVGTAYAMLYLAMLTDPNYGEAYFEKLAAQRARVVRNNPMVAQLTASGEAAMGFNGIPYDANNILATNPKAPVTYAYLDIVTSASTYMVVNGKAQHPNIARLFASWIMSPAGQLTHNGDGRASSPLGNLPGTLTAPEQKMVRRDITIEKSSGEYQKTIETMERIFK
ncbi:MAG: extracellular solute-binding protein [Betaproteobacteria bacterium]|nr:extracellular solute-binding protein [Betaproteobacteria bacterium]